MRSNTRDLLDHKGLFVRYAIHDIDLSLWPTGIEGKVSVNVVLTDKLGIRNEVQPEYWQRFEDAFALEANTFTEAELKERTGSCRCPLEGKFNEKGECI
ncbi:putative nad binding rossmann fold [Diaporthe ampelina]|uniref:Putative nad binding rossmann fold n=1 Tax=Diaporthe ampelina TaxID=1214573 RepID=A0A0G2HWF3_9PEZI|nr:putative nad binding rossmann fold [Diaporthe ampelina]